MRKKIVYLNEMGRIVTSTIILAEIFGLDHGALIDDILECFQREDEFKQLFINTNPDCQFYAQGLGGRTLSDIRAGSDPINDKAYFEITKDGFRLISENLPLNFDLRYQQIVLNQFLLEEDMKKTDEYLLRRFMEVLINPQFESIKTFLKAGREDNTLFMYEIAPNRAHCILDERLKAFYKCIQSDMFLTHFFNKENIKMLNSSIALKQ